MSKKVYSESGHYLGTVQDVILVENQIKSLKIKLGKKYEFNKDGIILDYKYVKGVSEIIIIDNAITEHLQK